MEALGRSDWTLEVSSSLSVAVAGGRSRTKAAGGLGGGSPELYCSVAQMEEQRREEQRREIGSTVAFYSRGGASPG